MNNKYKKRKLLSTKTGQTLPSAANSYSIEIGHYRGLDRQQNTLQKRNTDIMYWRLGVAGLRTTMLIAMAVAVNNKNYY